jgi:predicted glutamate--cysteine ligase
VLLKGFEIEIYTGTPQGEIVGMSDRIVANLDGFVREPDNRNVEYTTAPLASYDRLLCALVRPRQQLRHYLKTLGDYTLIPGSTLSLGGSDEFYRSDPQNPYHSYIEQTYHTKVVTASVHINIGISDPELLFRACRLVRVEAPLYLAMSASSPFLNGQVTGYHSTRWGVFPKTPAYVPLFTSHAHHIQWTEAQLAQGTMQNIRHLWTSVRPNGDHRPYNLNRLELRICDLIVDPIALLAVTALLEARLGQLIADPNLDPLVSSQFTPEELITLTEANEAAASRSSLEATLQHWQDGRKITAKDWITELLETAHPTAKQNGFGCFLLPVRKLLRTGNTAQQWLAEYATNQDPTQVLQNAIVAIEAQEQELADSLCYPLAA